MTVDYRRSSGRHYYETGAELAFAWPTFDSPKARLTFLRNPLYGSAYESLTLAQSVRETETRRVVASEIADVPARRMPLAWDVMPHGWQAGQRIKSAGTLLLPSEVNVAASTDYEAAIGFRNFSTKDTAPTVLRLEELDSVDNVLASHDFTPAGAELLQYPQGALRRLSATFTTHADITKFRWRITSSGEDFLVADPRCYQADGTESFPESSHYLDPDSDGIGGGWQSSGPPPAAEWYAHDWSGLSQWIELVAQGALEAFEVRRYGTGHVVTARIVDPLDRIEAPLHPSGMVSGVALTLLRED